MLRKYDFVVLQGEQKLIITVSMSAEIKYYVIEDELFYILYDIDLSHFRPYHRNTA